MASNPASAIRKLMPTAHRVLLERCVTRTLKNVGGRVLVIGSGYDPYRSLLLKTSDILLTDITNQSGMVDEIADAHALPYPDESFDVVIAIEVFEHLHSPAVAIRECHRVLTADGVLILSIPFLFHVHGDPFDYQRFTKQGILSLTEDYFSVQIAEIGGRLAVISDILTTGSKLAVPFRILNHLFRLPGLRDAKSEDCPSGYWVEARKL